MTAKDAYQKINWISLDTVRQHLFTRLQTPMQKAIELAKQSPANAVCQLQYAQNTLDAWSALIRWKQNPADIRDKFMMIDLRQAPDWVRKEIQRHATLSQEQSRQLYVHPAAFYEALLLLVQLARQCGKISQVMVNDASSPRGGIWFRIVFVPDESQFQSKLAIMDRLTERFGDDIPLQFALIADLLELNNTRFSLQNNTRTGHQAFAVQIDNKTMRATHKSIKKAQESQPPTKSAAAADKSSEKTTAPLVVEETTDTPAPAATNATPSAATEKAPPLLLAPPASPAAMQQKSDAAPAEAPQIAADLSTKPNARQPDQSNKPGIRPTVIVLGAPTRPAETSVQDNKSVEPIESNEATTPLPAISLTEKAEEIDETDDILAKVQDLLLDYMGTSDLLSRAEEVVSKIYKLIATNNDQIISSEKSVSVDRPKLHQLYAILKTKPGNGRAATPTELDLDEARDIVAAVQGLLLSPTPETHTHGDKNEPKEAYQLQVEARADEASQDPSVSQPVESSGK